MNIRQEILDNVIYGGSFDTIRGIIAELGLVPGDILKEEFHGALFWTQNADEFALAYSNEVMVLNKNGVFVGVAKYDPTLLMNPLVETSFNRGGGAISLAHGML